jgi:hypothetical protein
VGGGTQGQRQVFAQGQQGFKEVMGLHGVSPSSNHGFIDLRKSGTRGQTCVGAFDQTPKGSVASMQ